MEATLERAAVDMLGLSPEEFAVLDDNVRRSSAVEQVSKTRETILHRLTDRALLVKVRGTHPETGEEGYYWYPTTSGLLAHRLELAVRGVKF